MKRKQPGPARRSRCCGVVMADPWCPRCSRVENGDFRKTNLDGVSILNHIEISEGPDKEGRYRYTLTWQCPATGRERGQCFHAPLPQEYIERGKVTS